MKKITFLAVSAFLAIVFTSCHVQQAIMPRAINTMAQVDFYDLKLDRSEYTILKNIQAEAAIKYHQYYQAAVVEELNGEFSITWRYDKKSGKYYRHDFSGIARFGFLNNDYDSVTTSEVVPEYFVRNLAIYRAIQACKALGGDALIEPLISTNVEQSGKDVIFKTTVSAKVVKIKTDK